MALRLARDNRPGNGANGAWWWAATICSEYQAYDRSANQLAHEHHRGETAMTKSLDLSPLVDGYNWLVEHEQHFSMNHWISKLAEKDGEESWEDVLTTPVEPECGTVLCLCGAALLVNAQKNQRKELTVAYGSEGVLVQFIDILGKVNPQWDGEWGELKSDLRDLFLGDWFKDEYDIDIEDVTLELVRDGIESVCSRWNYTPVFIERLPDDYYDTEDS